MYFNFYSSVNFDEAVQFKNRLRNVNPPVYNPRRLNEAPIPPLEGDENLDDDEENYNWFLHVSHSDESNEHEQSSNNENERSIDHANVNVTEFLNDDDDSGQDVDPLQLPDQAENEASSSMHEPTTSANKNNTSVDGDQITENLNEASVNESNNGTDPKQIIEQNGNDLVADNIRNENNTDNNSSDGDGNAERCVNEVMVNESHNDTDNSDEFIAQNMNDETVHESRGNTNSGHVIDPVEASPNITDAVEVKPEISDIQRTGNESDIDSLLEEMDEIGDDSDVTIIMGDQTAMPQPMKTLSDDMIKRENDAMSGDIAFNEKVNIFKNYPKIMYFCEFFCLFIIYQSFSFS